MVEVRVCVGTSCHLNGSYNVVQDIQQLIEKNTLHGKLNLEAIFCTKQCQAKGVSIKIDNEEFRIEPNQIQEFFEETIKSRIPY